MRTGPMILTALAAVLFGATAATAVTWWMPLREVRAQAYVTPSGDAVPRYQWRFVADERGGDYCVLILTDTESGRFAIATVPPDACR